MDFNWKQKIEDYCKKYNIPFFYLTDILEDPKVTPMIRGKAFEFSVLVILKELLLENEWDVSKPVMNSQLGFPDVDLKVVHKKTNKIIRIECKLAKKESYRFLNNGDSEIRVKCMRSRTLGPVMVKKLAPKIGISEKTLSVHNDQYLPTEFDLVVTSIGNAFYRTDEKTGKVEWKPTKKELGFCHKVTKDHEKNIKDSIFEKIFLAKTSDLVVNKDILCTRRLCSNAKNCGFVPNYPIIHFDQLANPTNGWVSVEDFLKIFQQICNPDL